MSDLVVFVLRGLPASGKTTKSMEYMSGPHYCLRVSKDHYRWMVYAVKPYGPQYYRSAIEPIIKQMRDDNIRVLLKNKRNVVIDDTNLRREDMVEIERAVGGMARIEIVDLRHAVSFEVCCERNSEREEGLRVPMERMREMNALIPPRKEQVTCNS